MEETPNVVTADVAEDKVIPEVDPAVEISAEPEVVAEPAEEVEAED